jgi:hypothetical protein
MPKPKYTPKKKEKSVSPPPKTKRAPKRKPPRGGK